MKAKTEVTEESTSSTPSLAGEGQVDREVQLLELLKQGENLDLPVPFRSLYVRQNLGKGRPLSLSVVRELSKWIPITRLAFYGVEPSRDPGITPYVTELLNICSATLTDLEMQYWDQEQPHPKVAIQFPGLKKLTLKRPTYMCGVDSSTFMETEEFFFKSAILSSPSLKEIVLAGVTYSPRMLKMMELRKIEDLTVINLYTLPGTRNVWEELNNVKFGHLKSLNLGTGMNQIEAGVFQALIANFSGTLERLIVPVRIQNLPVCPKLTHLDCVTLLPDAWDPNLLPALKSLKLRYFLVPPPHRKLRPFANVHEIYCCEFMAVEFKQLFGKQKKEEVLGQLMGLLPNATSWTLFYRFFQGFVNLAPGYELNVESLRISIDEQYLFSFEAERIAYKQTIAALSTLSNLEELTLCHPGASSASNRFQVEAIDFKSMPKLRTFRHIGAGIDKCLDLNEHFSSLDSVVVSNYEFHTGSAEAKLESELLTQWPNLELAFRGKRVGWRNVIL